MPAAFVSFAEVKSRVAFAALLDHYGLAPGFSRKGESLAGPCPLCGAGGKRPLAIDLKKNAWYCFGGCRAGGNILDFVARKEGVEVRKAAELLDQWFALGLSSKSPPKEEPRPNAPSVALPPPSAPSRNLPLTFSLKDLEPAHPAFLGYGISEPTVRAFGAGYCAKGLMKGRLAVPIHGRAGDLLAYLGIHADPEAPERYKFPPNFNPDLEVFNLHRVGERAEDELHLTGQPLDVLYLAEQGLPGALGLFTSALSGAQQALLGDFFPAGTSLTLLAHGEELDSIASRLARHFAVRIRSLAEFP